MNATTPPKTPSPRRRKDARPAELTTAALHLFVEKGYAATRLEDVAALAGVSKGTLYLYFENKEALFKAVIQEGIIPVLEKAENLTAQSRDSAAELLRDLLEMVWQKIGSTPLAGIPKLMVSEAGNFPDIARYYNDNVLKRGQSLLRHALSLGISSGEFRAVDMDMAIDVIIAPILMLTIMRHSLAPCCGIDTNPQRYIATLVDLCLNGLLKK